jgi:hypothetical protein
VTLVEVHCSWQHLFSLLDGGSYKLVCTDTAQDMLIYTQTGCQGTATAQSLPARDGCADFDGFHSYFTCFYEEEIEFEPEFDGTGFLRGTSPCVTSSTPPPAVSYWRSGCGVSGPCSVL